MIVGARTAGYGTRSSCGRTIPLAAPVIAPNYLGTPHDHEVATRTLRLMRRIAGSPALAPFQPEEFGPGVQFQSDDELVRAAGEIGTTIFHPVGTATMETAGDPAAVVDAELRVIEASVMPTITSGNTYAPTPMIAEKGAWLVLRARRR